jgi:hypothetical protein
MKTKKMKGWINLYVKSGEIASCLKNSKQEALNDVPQLDCGYIKTVYVEEKTTKITKTKKKKGSKK